MKSPIVKILVSVTDPDNFEACTLCFPTIRKGWPTARIVVDVNPFVSGRLIDVVEKADAGGVNRINILPQVIHLGEWIRQAVTQHCEDRPLVIVDPDTMFHKSCEDWEFPTGTLLAGYHVPKIWNDFAKCVSVPRFHTSMMVFPDVPALRDVIKRAYPWSGKEAGEYCPCDPFMPAVRFIYGKPIFWDCCANLYSMLESDDSSMFARITFTAEHLDCFTHLNSASFAQVMRARVGPEWVQKFNSVTGVKELWAMTNAYYQAKAEEAAGRADSSFGF